MSNKKLAIVFVFSFLFGIFLIGNVLGAISYCCEKTKVADDGSGGAWCVGSESPDTECADTGCGVDGTEECAITPTACISTSYCKFGTCVDKRDGECITNVAQGACPTKKGSWFDLSPGEIPQCQLGCCAIGEQAAFVTQKKCTNFASLYGIETHFQQNIQNEISCIASAFPAAKGACVFEREFETTCKMTTRSDCSSISEAEFHEGFLCTAEDLATNCAVTDKTTCVEGKDEVFFLDSCGNIANMYDKDMIQKSATGQVSYNSENEYGELYWKTISAPKCTLTRDVEGKITNAKDCGDCNYYEGSTCKKYDRSKDGTKPEYGDNVCRDLGCKFDNDGDGTEEPYLHGETWCASSGIAKGTKFLDVTGGDLSRTGINDEYSKNANLPGSRYFRMVCYNGEVTVEPCADRRAEVCIQSERDILRNDGTVARENFKSAVCRVNAWQGCVAQNNSEDCENAQERDCQWIGGNPIKNGPFGIKLPCDPSSEGCITEGGKCVPLVAPGFDFWGEEEGINDASAICGLASTTCTAEYSKKLTGSWEQENGEECFDGGRDYIPSWGTNQNNMCVSLGDCKGSVAGQTAFEKVLNYLRVAGS